MGMVMTKRFVLLSRLPQQHDFPGFSPRLWWGICMAVLKTTKPREIKVRHGNTLSCIEAERDAPPFRPSPQGNTKR